MITSIKSKIEYAHPLLQIIGGAIFLSLCSQIRIPLPFSIIPITLQTFCVLLLGTLFGSRQASLMVIGYWFQILIGLPVLPAGLSNPLVFVGPKAGYYFGFLVQAYCIGWLTEKTKTTQRIFQAGLIACAIQLLMGVCWLSQFVGFQTSLIMGLYPFIPGEILKVLAVTAFTQKLK